MRSGKISRHGVSLVEARHRLLILGEIVESLSEREPNFDPVVRQQVLALQSLLHRPKEVGVRRC